MMDLLGHIIVISFIWFIIYWMAGGVLFATIALINVIKLRRARFSCLFTLASYLSALGAAYMGTYVAKEQIYACVAEAEDVFGALASVIACGIFEHVGAGALWFIVLVVIGVLLLILSRATNQSWMDTEDGVFEDRFDVLEL